jgi:hypoxanthine-guanine phosphoribosyltransferase
MITYENINEIFERITENYSEPVPIGGRCVSNVYYRTEELTEEDLNICAQYVVERLEKILSPNRPEYILKLPGGYSFFAERLSAVFTELYPKIKEIPVEHYSHSTIGNGLGDKCRGKKVILVTDVITTARSSLEAHTKATLRGVPVLCWATLIDRTFGPGPVPVVSAFTGAPVRLLTHLA